MTFIAGIYNEKELDKFNLNVPEGNYYLLFVYDYSRKVIYIREEIYSDFLLDNIDQAFIIEKELMDELVFNLKEELERNYYENY